MKAKEKLGKRSTVRKEPHVGGAWAGSYIEPYSTITFVEIVTDKFQPLDSWLKLGDGRYVNYKIAGRLYYDVIDEVPEPEPDDGTFTATLIDDKTGETWSGILSKQ